MPQYAQEFYEIPDAVESNDELRTRIVQLVDSEPIPGKVTQGGDRRDSLRAILREFFEGEITLQNSIRRISTDLPRHNSQHSHDNRVFPSGWDERLARTQISRFYNQAVLQKLNEEGHEQCYIPHTDFEDRDSPCTVHLANGTADIGQLLDRLYRAYREGEWHEDVMIPDHPHCTHTVTPDEEPSNI